LHVVALQLDRLAEVAGVIGILEGVHFGAGLALGSCRSSRLLSVGGAGGLSALRRLGRLSYGHGISSLSSGCSGRRAPEVETPRRGVCTWMVRQQFRQAVPQASRVLR